MVGKFFVHIYINLSLCFGDTSYKEPLQAGWRSVKVYKLRYVYMDLQRVRQILCAEYPPASR
jgi:hypothetical protein